MGRTDTEPPSRVVIATAVLVTILSGALSSLVSGDVLAAPPGEAVQIVTVQQTYDRKPFEYRIESVTERSAYTVYRMTYPSPVVTSVPQNNTIPAEYYLPAGVRPGQPNAAVKRPAVICLHILDGNKELVRLSCSRLAARGIPAIFFMLPYYDTRALPAGPEAMAADPRLFLSAISQSMEDIRRTVDLLASRPEVDPERIGITGISMGGIVAAAAAEREPRLSRAMLVLAGGDLLSIIHYARETRSLKQLLTTLPAAERAKVEETIRAVDPLSHADRLRDRAQAGKVLMINAGEDYVIPRVCTEKLARALGIADRVEWLEGLGHYTALAMLPQVLETMARFFGQDLPAGLWVAAEPPVKRTPQQAIASLAQQGVDMFARDPGAGRSHVADLEIAVTFDKKSFQGRLRLLRGAGHRFKIEGRLPLVGDVALGQNHYPWMATVGKAVYLGNLRDLPPGNPLVHAEADQLVKLRVIAGAVGTMSMAPDLLDSIVEIVVDPTSTETPAIRIAAKNKKRPGTARLVFRADGATPDRIEFEVGRARGTVRFHAWQFDTAAPDAAFDPPSGGVEKQVDPQDLLRTFAAMFHFALESLE